MNSSDLLSLADLWLTGTSRPWTLRFPDRLEAVFERDTGADRNRTLAVMLLAATLAYLLWDVIGLLSDNGPSSRYIHALAIVPLDVLSILAFRHGLRPTQRETLASALAICTSVSLVGLHAAGAWLSAAMCSIGVIVTILLATMVFQLRAPYAAASVAAMFAALVAGLLLGPTLPPNDLRRFAATAFFAALIAGLANRRQEREFRSAYLMTLKERLRLRALGQRNRELDLLTRHDALTGLPNRRAFDLWLDDPGVQSALPWSLIAIDIDHFKSFNDHYGHPAGDQCLCRVGTCLRAELAGVSDLLARVGGEEFAVLLPATSRAAAAAIGERLRLAVARMEVPHEGPGAAGYVTISAGVAQVSVNLEAEARRLIAAADLALYEAKRAGRNRVCTEATP